MLGAIIGDIAGSTYEVNEMIKLKQKEQVSYEDRVKIMNVCVPLFNETSSLTDDSVLTIAIADAVINNKDYGKKLREYGEREIKLGYDKYGRSRFGKGFETWVKDGEFTNSFGNGCAMRLSSIPTLLNDEKEAFNEVYKATIPTHNHPESLLCSYALTKTILMAKQKHTKEEIKQEIETNYFKLDYDIETLRYNYKFTSRAINSVPQAIFAFLESTSFEDAIRKAISIGGDADTIAAITGSIAENYYGIPPKIIDDVKDYIPLHYLETILKFYTRKKDETYVKRLSKSIN